MKEKKPCDDIFEGLAELIINNGEVTANHYIRDRRFNQGAFKLRVSEDWSVNYGDSIYLINSTDGVVDAIRRFKNDKESEDD